MSRRFLFAVSLVLCLPALLEAQIIPINPHRSALGRQTGLQQVDVSGTIQKIVRNGVVVSNGNQVWNVAIVRPSKVAVGTKVQVTGTMTAKNLQSGLIVELSADLDNRSTIQGKIDTLTITSLTRDKQMGVFADDAGFAGNDLDKSAKRPTKSGKGRAQIVGRCRIVGQLIVNRSGSLSVKSGHGTMSFELGDGAKINVDMADLSLARLGQDISIKGVASPRQPNMVQATEVTIKLPEVADADKADKKEPPAKPEAKKAAKAPKKDKDEGLPEPGDSKPDDSKPGDSKPGDSKPADSK
jgi:hypothetical protein